MNRSLLAATCKSPHPKKSLTRLLGGVLETVIGKGGRLNLVVLSPYRLERLGLAGLP
jgi:hypothetical protein